MEVILIRHSITEGNALKRYIGVTDQSLTDQGIALAKSAPTFPCDAVYVTPLRRTRQTAALLFPEAEQHIIDGLQEMDFGVFENRSADEMEHDAQYRSWVDSMCLDPCPGGESMAGFAQRVCAAFESVIAQARSQGREQAVFVIHGGTAMAILARYGRPVKDYYAYNLKNCQRYRCRLEAPGKGEDVPFILTDLRLEG